VRSPRSAGRATSECQEGFRGSDWGSPVSRLDWPVRRGGAAVVRLAGVEEQWAEGTDRGVELPLASVTKLLTTMAALAAVQAGHVDLDQRVDQEGATVRHLLAHASGLPQNEGRRRQLAERRVYSNAGFRVLAEAVADAVGTSFEAWLASAVLDPLDMRATRLATYDGVEADPAAGAVSTLADLVRLARCLLGRGAPVTGPELFAEATRVQFPGLAGLVPGVGRFDPCDWGLGFELRDGKRPHWMGERRSPAAFGHFGSSGCFLWVDPEVDLAAVAITDRDFDDQRWAMGTWPAWSDRLPAA
jgi:CubicO group peptidase (beta-lactamase class C family)